MLTIYAYHHTVPRLALNGGFALPIFMRSERDCETCEMIQFFMELWRNWLMLFHPLPYGDPYLAWGGVARAVFPGAAIHQFYILAEPCGGALFLLKINQYLTGQIKRN